MTHGIADDPDKSLAEAVRRSNVARLYVGERAEKPKWIDATPFLAKHLVCGRRLRLGRAAAVLDPVSGGGLAFSLRSAILLAASISLASGHFYCRERARLLFGHYARRLGSAFAEHLQCCDDFYRSGGLGADWVALINSARRRADDRFLDVMPISPLRLIKGQTGRFLLGSQADIAAFSV